MLKPLHPFTPSVSSFTVEGEVDVRADGIAVRFKCTAKENDFASISLPFSSVRGTRSDELWKSTCFECFFGVEGSTEYFELNTAPNGDWAWYAFSDYRKEMRSPSLIAEDEPRLLSARQTQTLFESEWFIPRAALEQKRVKDASITAVLAVGSEVSYWALKHAGTEPDFHLRSSFEGTQ